MHGIARKVDPMEQSPIRVDMTMTESLQKEFPFLSVVTERSKIFEKDLIISSK